MKKSCRILCAIISMILMINLMYIPVSAQETSSESTTQETTSVTQNEESGEDVSSDDNKDVPANGNDVVVDSGDAAAGLDEEEPEEIVEEKEEYITDLKFETTEENIIKLAWTIKNPEFNGYVVKVFADQEMEKQVGEDLLVEDATIDTYNIDTTVLELEKDVVYYVSVIPYKTIDETGEEGKSLIGELILLSAPVVTAKAEDAQIVLSWEAISGATAYEVYDAVTGTVVQKVTETTCTVKELKNDTAYSYKLKAIADFEKYSWESDLSDEVTATPKIVKPGKVALSIRPANKAAVLTWQAVTGATSYYVYRYNSSTKKWVRISHTKSTTYTNSGLKTGTTYYYKVAAVRTSGGVTITGDLSSQVKLKASTYLTGSVRPMYFKGTIIRKTKAYSSKASKKVVKYLKKGTRVTILSQGGKLQVQLSNGKKYWISRKNVRFTSSIYTTKDYTTYDKENYVNKNGYSSKTPYLIWISQYTQRVNIYKGSKGNWELIKTCRVATGKHTTRTPKGTFKITYREKGWYYTSTCVKKIVHFAGRNSFHSRIYKYNGKLSDATIGRPKSNGCVRMYMEDINYIYNKMPIGTTVVSY